MTLYPLGNSNLLKPLGVSRKPATLVWSQVWQDDFSGAAVGLASHTPTPGPGGTWTIAAVTAPVLNGAGQVLQTSGSIQDITHPQYISLPSASINARVVANGGRNSNQNSILGVGFYNADRSLQIDAAYNPAFGFGLQTIGGGGSDFAAAATLVAGDLVRFTLALTGGSATGLMENLTSGLSWNTSVTLPGIMVAIFEMRLGRSSREFFDGVTVEFA